MVFNKFHGVAMGSPLAPSLANIFLNNLESEFLNANTTNGPSFYRRYVDDTFTQFNSVDEAERFLVYINSLHPNIKFTMDIEKEGKLSFLDILVFRSQNLLCTSVFRKASFTGQACHFFSESCLLFKSNMCNTLIHRAYKICSSYHLLHVELEFLKKMFISNGFSVKFVENHIKKYLDKIYDPASQVPTVDKDIRYFSFPYISSDSTAMKKDLLLILNKAYPHINFRFVFKNKLQLGSFFKVKESFPFLARSNVVYKYSCPSCEGGFYIGSTVRLLKNRVCNHLGISHRTSLPLSVKEFSSIRNHSLTHKKEINSKDFKILLQSKDAQSLQILESLALKKELPNLNLDSSAVSLFIA